MREFTAASPPAVLRLAPFRRETTGLVVLMAICAAGGLLVVALSLRQMLAFPNLLDGALLLLAVATGLLLAIPCLWLLVSLRKTEAHVVELGAEGMVVPSFGSWYLPKRADRLVLWSEITSARLVQTPEEIELIPGLKNRRWMPVPHHDATASELSAIFDARGPVGPRDLPLLAVHASKDRLFIFAKVLLEPSS